MPTALHIVAACSNRKRFESLSHHRLREHPRGPRRVRDWILALGDGSGHAVPARQLYVGNHWAAVRDAPTIAAEAGWTDVNLWVASAGYGLVSADDAIVPYSATFSSGHPDSVLAPSEGRHQSLLRGWWAALADERRSRTSMTCVADLVKQNPEAAIIVVASGRYVAAMSGDILGALGLARSGSIVIVSSGVPDHTGLRSAVIDAGGSIQPAVGGPMTSLGGRLFQRLLRDVSPARWNLAELRGEARRLAALATPRHAPDRVRVSDDEVRAFVSTGILEDRDATATRLLRMLRIGGRACEQSRFKELFWEVRRTHTWAAPGR